MADFICLICLKEFQDLLDFLEHKANCSLDPDTDKDLVEAYGKHTLLAQHKGVGHTELAKVAGL